MRIALLGLLLLATPALAQDIAAPVPPTPPTATMPAMTSGGAPAPARNDMMQQLQKMMGKKTSSDSVGQVIVIGSLLGCTQKTAGQEATNAFYSEMQTVGKTIEGYCKQHRANDARALLLSTVANHKDNAVVKSALTCYDAQKESVAAMGGPRLATDAANYAKWIRDPELAKREVKESDICRGKATARAAPAATSMKPAPALPTFSN